MKSEDNSVPPRGEPYRNADCHQKTRGGQRNPKNFEAKLNKSCRLLSVTVEAQTRFDSIVLDFLWSQTMHQQKKYH